VDAQDHGIPVEATLTLTDLTTATVLGSETTATGQATAIPTRRRRTALASSSKGASDFFGPDLPPGVAPTDTVELTIDGFAIVKP
jgi:hypothetical protein